MTENTKNIQVNNEAAAPEDKTERIRDREVFLPRTDIYETDQELVLVMDVPGVDENSLEMTLEKNILSINAYPVFDQPENFALEYSEYAEGDYQRSFKLSDGIDREKIQAHVKNGVLTLHLPKAAEVAPQRITVKAG